MQKIFDPSLDLHLWIGVMVLTVLALFPPTRALLVMIFKELKIMKPIFSGLRHVLHEIVTAHMSVIRNFQPRQRVFMELSRKRTSYTEIDRGS